MNLPAGPWAILRSHLDTYALADAPDLMADADMSEVYAARERANQPRGSVAVLPIVGPITKHDTMCSLLFGGTSTDRITAQAKAMAADEGIRAVILNVDSPGGTTAGLPEAAEAIRKLREQKTVLAFVNPVAASAAYWLASQADEIIGSPESLSGSIGVYLVHADISEALAQDGIKPTVVSSSPEKVEGSGFEPLSDEAREHLQTLVDASHELFVKDVAKGRGVTASKVRAGFGNGRVLDASAALSAGLIDRVGTLDGVVSRAMKARRLGASITVSTTYAVGPEEVVTSNASETDDEPEGDAPVPTFEGPDEDAALPSLDRWRFNR